MSKPSSRSKSRGPRPRLESLERRTNPVAGALDPSFGGDHKVTTPIGLSTDHANGLATQSDGKIVLAGYSFNGNNDEFAVVRYNSDGSLDTTFGGDGKVTTPFGSSDAVGNSVGIQVDGKIVVAGYSRTGSNKDFAVVRYNVDGSLDSSFDGDGKLTLDLGSEYDVATGVVIQPDGKIVAAGYSAAGGNYDFAVLRYNVDGSLDTTFDSDGIQVTTFGLSTSLATGVALQTDNKIVVAGYSYNGSNNSFAVARYNVDGSLDTTFGGDGTITTPFGSFNAVGKSAAIQADGKIVVAGNSFNGSNDDFAVARYNADGSLDTSFDSDGKLTTAFGSGTDVANSVAIQADGKIVAAGYAAISYEDFALVRYNSDGSLDTSFDGDGKLTTAFGSGTDVASSVAIQGDGKIVAAGYANTGGNYDFALVRFRTDGTVDRLSEGNGTLTIPFGSSEDGANGVAIQADGKIVVAGYAGILGNNEFALSRYDADGGLDASFDGDGKLTTDIGPSDDVATCLAIQSDGKIIVAGYSSNGYYNDFALARYNADGSLDTSFDGDGKVTTEINSLHDVATSLAIQADGKIVVVGYSSNGYYNDFALVRYNADGSLDTSFDGDGKLITEIGGLDDYATSVAIQPNGKIVVAGKSDNDINYDFALARYNSDGSLDTSFNFVGKQVIVTITKEDGANSVAIQADGKIVAAGYFFNVNTPDFALARYNPDGSPDASFDGDGRLTTPIGSSGDIANSLAIQPDGKIVAAGQSWNGYDNDFALARYNPDGSVDSTFDFDGKLTSGIGFAEDAATGVAIQADGKIVAAGYSRNGGNYDFALIRVRGDNHAPVTTPATFQATEDSVVRVSSPTYFSDPDGDTIIATLMTGPTHGTLQFAANGAFAYAPDPNYVGPDSFLYKLKDPDGTSDIGAIMINVVNDAADRLELLTSNGVVTFTESVPPPSTPVAIDAGVQVGSALEGIITSATVKITSGYVPKKDTLTFAKLGAIKGTFNFKTGTLTLSGAASPADYQAALRSVKYANYSAQPVDGLRTIAIQVKDAAGAGDPATRLLRVVGVNTMPTLTLPATGLTYKSRGRGLTVASTLRIADLDNSRLMGATISIGAGFAANLDALSVTTRTGITATYDGTAGILTLTGNATLNDYLAVLKSLTFKTPMAAPTGLRQISITVTDGLLNSDPVTRNVTIL